MMYNSEAIRIFWSVFYPCLHRVLLFVSVFVDGKGFRTAARGENDGNRNFLVPLLSEILRPQSVKETILSVNRKSLACD